MPRRLASSLASLASLPARHPASQQINAMDSPRCKNLTKFCVMSCGAVRVVAGMPWM
jgi:hypothetical protein